MDNLRTWWQGLASREQQLVGFLFGILSHWYLLLGCLDANRHC